MDAILYHLGALVLAGAAAFGIVVGFRVPARRIVERQEEAARGTLAELFIFELTPRHLTYLMVAASAISGLLFAMFAVQSEAGIIGTMLLFLVGVAVGYFAPRGVIYVLQRRRRRRLNEQLVDGLVTLANGMRAGLNLVQSMKLIVENADPPIQQEFGLMIREYEHGTSVDEMLRRASARIKLHHYKLLFAAMETARVRGGNLPETLDRLGESLREINRLEEKVRSMTAQNRMSARMMVLAPFLILLMYWAIDEDFIGDLLNDQWGLLVLGIATGLSAIAYVWIHKIVSFEI
jgi:tight adherence protein B